MRQAWVLLWVRTGERRGRLLASPGVGLWLLEEQASRPLGCVPGPLVVGEEAELAFVTAFRELLRLKNVLMSFADFTFDDTAIAEQEFIDYTSKYLDLHRKVQGDHEKEKVSILEDVDFELELTHRDEINVDYIVRLLAGLVNAEGAEGERLKQNILRTASSDAVFRSKRELIEKFIDSTIPKLSDAEQVQDAFDEFWSHEEAEAFEKLCAEEGLKYDELKRLIDDYIYHAGRKPRRQDIVNALEVQPKVLERQTIVKRITDKFNRFVETFIEGV